MTKTNWNKLKDFKCPKCGNYLAQSGFGVKAVGCEDEENCGFYMRYEVFERVLKNLYQTKKGYKPKFGDDMENLEFLNNFDKNNDKEKNNKNIDDIKIVLQAITSDSISDKMGDRISSYRANQILDIFEQKLQEVSDRKVEEIRESIYIKFGEHKKRKGDFLPLYLDEIAEILQYKSN